MSFSQQIKNEIINNKAYRGRNKAMQGYGLYLFAKSFCEKEILIHTELEPLCDLYIWFSREIIGYKPRFDVLQLKKRGHDIFAACIPDYAERKLLFDAVGQGIADIKLQEDIQLFISGAFMACGSMSDPNKSYHLEFDVAQNTAAEILFGYVSAMFDSANMIQRRKSKVIYIKECSQIEDFLTMIGAPKASLELIDIEMFKSVRNRANRATNCETANIDKQVEAAAKQIEDIKLVLSAKGEEYLSEALKISAEIRLNNPDLSLRDLCDLFPEPVSRSGLYHRYAQISKIAEEIRALSSG